MCNLSDEQVAIVARLLGHHTTGQGILGQIYDILANKCDYLSLDIKEPLSLEIVPSHPYGDRVLFKLEGK